MVILWGERIGAAALPALLSIASRLGLAEREGAGLLEIPAGANGRGLREVGAVPNAGPGYDQFASPDPFESRTCTIHAPYATQVPCKSHN